MTLTLDRVALEDVGLEPRRLAEAILKQIGYCRGTVPIAEIAYALGITEIREELLMNLEGTLITTPERDCGSILINKSSSLPRRRFSIGHEVGHYLNPYHADDDATPRACSKQDLAAYTSPSADKHRRQETEANRFAIEILAPKARCAALIKSEPGFADILAIRREFDISREAAARRYVELHDEPIAVAFSKDGRLTYSVRSESCPVLSVRKGDALSLPATPRDPSQPTEMADADPEAWKEPFPGELMLQTLFQSNGHAMSLIHLTPAEEEETEIEDTFERLSGMTRRP